MAQRTEAAAKTNGQAKPQEPAVIPRALYKVREFSNNDWLIHLPDKVQRDDLDKPGTWALAPVEMVPLDIIRAFGANFFAEIMVRQSIPHQALQVVVLRVVQLPAAAQDESDRMPAGFSILYNQRDGWVVTRDADQVVMFKSVENPNIRSREDAIRALKDHATLRETLRK